MSTHSHPVQRPHHQLAIAVMGCAAVSFTPSLLRFGARLWQADHYSFFPLYILALLAIGVKRWAEDGPFEPRFTTLTLVRWLPSVLLLAMSVWLHRPWIAGVGFVFAVRAAIFNCGGSEFYKSVKMLWWALWLCVPLPFRLDLALIQGLQHFASGSASQVLDLLGYRHLLTGVLLNFPGVSFEVEAACSGVHSLFASMAGVAIYCVLQRRGLVRTLSLELAAVFWVLVLNVVRILCVVLGDIEFGLSLTQGLVHELTGFIIFGVTVLFVMSTDRMFMYVLPEVSAFRDGQSRGSVPLLSKLASLQVAPVQFSVLLSSVFVLLAGLSLVRSVSATPLRIPGEALVLSAELLPAEVAGWSQTGFEVVRREVGDRQGEVSCLWTFKRKGLVSTVAVDGPFGAWHDLGSCYSGVGWRISQAGDLELPVMGDKMVASEMQMEDSAGQSGHVVFAVLSPDGRAIAPPPLRIGAAGGARLQGGLGSLLVPRGSGSVDGPAYCVQALCKVPLSLSEEERASHRLLLADAISLLKASLAGEAGNVEVQR